MNAVWSGFELTVNILIEAGSDISVKDKKGDTALHLASRKGYDKIVTKLLDQGADINISDYKGQTPLMNAVVSGHVFSFTGEKHRHESTVKILLEAGANTTTRDNYGRTVLHMAAGRGLNNMVKILLNHGMDVNIKGANGKTPLFEAGPSTVKILLEAGAYQ